MRFHVVIAWEYGSGSVGDEAGLLRYPRYLERANNEYHSRTTDKVDRADIHLPDTGVDFLAGIFSNETIIKFEIAS